MRLDKSNGIENDVLILLLPILRDNTCFTLLRYFERLDYYM